MHTDRPQFQGLGHYRLGEHTSQLTPLVTDEGAPCLHFLSLSVDLFLPSPLLGFATARASHVSLLCCDTLPEVCAHGTL